MKENKAKKMKIELAIAEEQKNYDGYTKHYVLYVTDIPFQQKNIKNSNLEKKTKIKQ